MKNSLFIAFLLPFVAQAQSTIEYLSDGIYKVENGGATKWGFYKPNTKDTITSARFDSLYYREWHGKDVAYYKLRQDGKWGIWDKNRRPIMPIKYDEVYYNHQAQPSRIEARLGSLWGIFSPEGKELIPVQYDEIQSDGFNYKVRKGDKFGIFDAEGTQLIAPCYENIYDHGYLDRSLVLWNDKWTVYRWINNADPCQPDAKFLYDGVGYFLDYFMVKKDGKYGLLDENAKEILPLAYESLDVFYEPYLRTVIVEQNGKFGLLRIDSTQKVHTEIPIEYDDIWVEKESLKMKVKLGDKIDYYYENAPYFAMEYNNVQWFETIKMFTIKKNGKWGLARENKEITITPKYEKINIFSKNDFWVQKNGKWGLVDVRGRTKVPPAYSAYEYSEQWQIFFVAKGDKWGIVSPRMGVVLSADYEDVIILTPKMYLVMKDGYWGIMGVNKQTIAPTVYKSVDISDLKNGIPRITLIDVNGLKQPFKVY